MLLNIKKSILNYLKCFRIILKVFKLFKEVLNNLWVYYIKYKDKGCKMIKDLNLKKNRPSLEDVGTVERYPLIIVAVGDGGVGKTPISYAIGSFIDSLILTNDDGILEGMSIRGFKQMSLQSIIDEVDLDSVCERMPVIIDMGGYAEAGAVALFKKADFVFCPVNIDSFGIERAYDSIEAISEYCDNIAVINTFSKSTLTNTKEFDEVQNRLSNLNIKAFFEIKKTNIFNNALSKKIGVTELWTGANSARAGTYSDKKGMKTPSIKSQIEALEKFVREI